MFKKIIPVVSLVATLGVAAPSAFASVQVSSSNTTNCSFSSTSSAMFSSPCFPAISPMPMITQPIFPVVQPVIPGLTNFGSQGLFFFSPFLSPSLPVIMPTMPSVYFSSGLLFNSPVTTNLVNITNQAFAPLSIAIPVGTTVIWTNHDTAPQSILFFDGTSSGLLNPGQTFAHTFMLPGIMTYSSSLYPMLMGMITIQ